MSSAAPPLSFGVLFGSVRQPRMGIRAPNLVMDALQVRGHQAVLVDPPELPLPLLDCISKEYATGIAPPILEQLATLYRRVDGFVSSVANTTTASRRP